MREFARLYTALDETTATGEKVEALAAYFGSAPAADAAWAVHFLTGRRPKRLVSSVKLAAWAGEAAGIPPWLFDESYAAVGDLAETITLLLPDTGASSDRSLAHWVEERLLPLRGQEDEVQRRAMLAGVGRARPPRAIRVEQAHHRRVSRGRVVPPGRARPRDRERRARGRHRPPADGRLGAHAGVLRPAPGVRRPGCRREPALPVLSRLSARNRCGSAGAEVGLAGGVEVGRDSLAAHSPREPHLSLVARRGVAERTVSRGGGRRRATAGGHGARWRAVALDRSSPVAVRPDAATHRPQDGEPEDPRGGAGGSRRLRSAGGRRRGHPLAAAGRPESATRGASW